MTLTIQVDTCFQIEDTPIEILDYLGNREDVYYFKTLIHSSEKATEGLLRVGSLSGGLHRELTLRDYLKDHKMLSSLVKVITEPSVEIQLASIETPSLPDSNYLEEEYYPEEEIDLISPEKLLILSQYPENTLDNDLETEQNLNDYLLVISQICQFFRYVTQGNWCFVSLLPQYIQKGSLIKFYDLTSVYPLNSTITLDSVDSYSAPELAYGHQIVEQHSTYAIGKFLYQILPRENLETLSPSIKRVPLLSQILSLSLSPIPENRLPLSQLLNLLVTLRKNLSFPRLYWEIGSHSIVGLSNHRLNNEDSYLVVEKRSSQTPPLILAAVADGMGGLAQGELASQSASAVLEKANFKTNLENAEQRQKYLNSLVWEANQAVLELASQGGTTLSSLMATGRYLNIAHVGDSRIYLIRNSLICQISEDHSLVGMLVANGQITTEESLTHQDRSVLLRSLGSKPHISSEYIQTLERFGGEISLTLQDQDILLLCSDGVWDLVNSTELLEIFTQATCLQKAVELTLDQVLSKGANDNATLIALRVNIQSGI